MASSYRDSRSHFLCALAAFLRCSSSFLESAFNAPHPSAALWDDREWPESRRRCGQTAPGCGTAADTVGTVPRSNCRIVPRCSRREKRFRRWHRRPPRCHPAWHGSGSFQLAWSSLSVETRQYAATFLFVSTIFSSWFRRSYLFIIAKLLSQ